MPKWAYPTAGLCLLSLLGAGLGLTGARESSGPFLEHGDKRTADAVAKVQSLLEDFEGVEMHPPYEFPQRLTTRAKRVALLNAVLREYASHPDVLTPEVLLEHGFPAEQQLIDLREMLRQPVHYHDKPIRNPK